MSQYSLTPQEVLLLKLPLQVQKLKVLQKSTTSRIQIVSFKGINAIKSVDDGFRKIRIVVISMLVKIFNQYSTSSSQKLQRLKKIIYSSKLEQLTQQKGILRQNLLKSVCMNLNQLKISHRVQMDIIRLFNCSPFFDEVIMNSIKQKNPLAIDNDCELGSWVDRQFSLKIVWNEQSFLEQNSQQLCLYGLGQQFHANKDCKSYECGYKSFHQYLRFSTQIYYSNVEQDIDQIYERVTRNQLFSCPLSPQNRHENKNSKSSQNYLSSISSVSPMTIKRIHDENKQNKGQKPTEKSPQIKLFRHSSKASNNEKIQQKQKQIKVKRNCKNKQYSFLWSILCCSNRYQ